MDRTTVQAVARLKQARVDKGLSLSRVATLAGVDKANLSRIESGKVLPTLGTLRNLTKALDVPIGSLFEEDDSPVERGQSDQRITIPGPPEFRFLHGWDKPQRDGQPSISRKMPGDRFFDHSRFQVDTDTLAPLFLRGDTLLASKSERPVEGSVVLGSIDGILFAVQLKPISLFGVKKTELHSVPIGKHGSKKVALMASQDYVNWTVVTEMRRALPILSMADNQR